MRSRDITLTRPLDHRDPGGRVLDVFARLLTPVGGDDLPVLVFLQGGPGNEAPRPTLDGVSPAWLARALKDYRVLLLDQRGTGNSTPVDTPDSVPGRTAAAKAEYLTHLRADEIVHDIEAFRGHLGEERISLLGQSFGGFTSVAYLSMFPDRLAEVYITGGAVPVGHRPDEIYARTYAELARKSRAFWRRFPRDAEVFRSLLDRCRRNEVVLPNGDVVGSAMLRTIGHRLGMTGGDADLHHLLERDPASPAFRYDLAGLLPFTGRNPLYAVIHESSYADGFTTGWSAERVRPADFDGDETLLTGEHVYPWHFTESSELAPWAEVAGLVARHPWPKLYDPDVLARTTARVAAVAYADDAFVPLDLSRETMDLVAGSSLWITNEWEHNGLRHAGERILDHLIELARGQE